MKILSAITKITVFVGIVVLLAIFGYAIFGDRVSIRTSPLVGSKAPQTTLNLFDGGKLALSDLRGNAVLVNFWASWCAPCREEAPALEAAWNEHRDDSVVFVGVNVWDERSAALGYLNKFGGGYLHGVDPKGEVAVEFGVSGVPETYFISPSGIVTAKYTGILNEEIIDYYLRRAISPLKPDGLTKKDLTTTNE